MVTEPAAQSTSRLSMSAAVKVPPPGARDSPEPRAHDPAPPNPPQRRPTDAQPPVSAPSTARHSRMMRATLTHVVFVSLMATPYRPCGGTAPADGIDCWAAASWAAR